MKKGDIQKIDHEKATHALSDDPFETTERIEEKKQFILERAEYFRRLKEKWRKEESGHKNKEWERANASVDVEFKKSYDGGNSTTKNQKCETSNEVGKPIEQPEDRPVHNTKIPNEEDKQPLIRTGSRAKRVKKNKVEAIRVPFMEKSEGDNNEETQNKGKCAGDGDTTNKRSEASDAGEKRVEVESRSALHKKSGRLGKRKRRNKDDRKGDDKGDKGNRVLDDLFKYKTRYSKKEDKRKKLKSVKRRRGKKYHPLPGIRTRTSPKKLCEAIKKMTTTQRNIVRRMGFGKILKLKVDLIKSALGHFVVDRLDTKKMVIRLGEQTIKVDKDSVQKLLGLPCGGIRVNIDNKEASKHPLISRWRGRFSRSIISCTDLVGKISDYEDEDEEMFQMDFVMLFISTMVGCTMNGIAMYTLLYMFDMDHSFREHDWCQFIIDAVKVCKNHWRRCDKNSWFRGPLTFLVLLYLDRTRSVGFDDEITEPPISYWNTERISQRQQMEIKNGGLGTVSVKELFDGDNEYDTESEEEVVDITRNDEGMTTENDVRYEMKAYVSSINAMCDEAEAVKGKLDRAISKFARCYPDTTEVLEAAERYKALFNKSFAVEAKSTVEKSAVCTDKKGNNDTDVSLKINQKCNTPGDDNSGIFSTPHVASAWTQTAVQLTEIIEDFATGKLDDEGVPVNDIRTDNKRPSPNRGTAQDFQSPEMRDIKKTRPQTNEVSKGKRKRIPKTAPFGRSPWLERAVNISKAITREENIVWEYVLEGAIDTQVAKPREDRKKDEDKEDERPLAELIKEKRSKAKSDRDRQEENEVRRTHANDIFCTAYGTHLMHFHILDLLPHVWLSTGIINCWASMLNHDEAKRREFTMPRLLCHTTLFTEEMLTKSSYDDNKRLDMFTSALRVVLEEKEELMDLKEYGNLIFPILDRGHYYLVCFDLKNLAITVIDNMDPSESPVKTFDGNDFFLKSTPMKVKDVVVKYLKRVRHPRCHDIAARQPVRLEISWATTGNYEDCGIYAMRHMETWMGITEDRWHVGFPTEMAKAKKKIAQLRKKYAVKLITSEANIHRERILKEAYQYAGTNRDK